MPLPMVHLAIAVQLAQQQHSFPTPAFLLGSIAPDAIHMRPNASRDDKHRTHLRQSPNPTGYTRICTLIAQHVALPDPLPDFATGYAAHLLTDQLWYETVFVPFREQLPSEIDLHTLRTIYYRDTDQIDFNLYYQVPWRSRVWERLASAQPVDFPPLLSAIEIKEWRDRTVNWFDGLKKNPNIAPQYITDAAVHQFIDQATEQIKDRFADWRD